MATPQQNEAVGNHTRTSLKLANKKAQDISKLVDDDPASDKTDKILRELSWLIYRVGEAIVDQVAAASAK